MTAEDAYETAMKTRALRLAQKMKPVMECIQEATADGEQVNPVVKAELVRLGYNVEAQSGFGEGYYVVSWDNPKRTERMGR